MSVAASTLDEGSFVPEKRTMTLTDDEVKAIATHGKKCGSREFEMSVIVNSVSCKLCGEVVR